jgi:hypothetical protein
MNKLLIENINRIKQLMSLITEDVDTTCVEGDCDNGHGTIKIDYVDGYMEIYEPFDRLIKGYMKNKKPNIDEYSTSSYLITFKNTNGDILAEADSELNKELGMTGYGNITFSDGTTYTGTFTQEKLGDSLSMDCKKIVKDNMFQNWDPYTQGLKEEYKKIKDIYYTHFILPDIKKSEEEERKKTEEEITNKIKNKEEDILNIKKSEEEQKQEEIQKYKKQEEDINSLISKDVRDVQDYIDNKNCSLLYDKITSMINSGTLATKEDFSDFEEDCKGELKIDSITGEVSVETNSKYSDGLYKAITDACSDYDWDILDDLI